MKQTQITAGTRLKFRVSSFLMAITNVLFLGSNDREKNSYNELERARDEARYAYKKIRERRIKAKKSL
jgi:hypothetical protein